MIDVFSSSAPSGRNPEAGAGETAAEVPPTAAGLGERVTAAPGGEGGTRPASAAVLSAVCAVFAADRYWPNPAHRTSVGYVNRNSRQTAMATRVRRSMVRAPGPRRAHRADGSAT